MVVYCTATDVKMWVKTTLDDELIDELIEQASAEIDKRIGVQSTSDKAIKKLCCLIVAYGIKIQHPQSEALGTRRVEMGRTLEHWRDEIDRLYRLYHTPIVKTSKYASIDEDSRFQG